MLCSKLHQHVEQRRSCPWFLTWPLLCLLQRCLNQLKSVSTQFRALCLFPEGVNVVPNAVLKSFSVSSKRLVIELKIAKRQLQKQRAGKDFRGIEEMMMMMVNS